MEKHVCVCCLRTLHKNNRKQFTLTNEVLKLSSLSEPLDLCFLCCRIAKKVEFFIRNVQSNQILLKNYNDETSLFPHTLLSLASVETIELSENVEPYEPYVVISRTNLQKCKNYVKEEIDREDNDRLKLISDQEDFAESTNSPCVNAVDDEDEEELPLKTYTKADKEIKCYRNRKKSSKNIQECSVKINRISSEVLSPVKLEIVQLCINGVCESKSSLCQHDSDTVKVKEEITEIDADNFIAALEDLKDPLKLISKKTKCNREKLEKNTKCLRNSKKKVKRKFKLEKEEELDENDVVWEIVHLTKEQCEQERTQRAKETKYVNAQYKCPDCILGFTFEMSYQTHMEKHSRSAGDYLCDVCNLRTTSAFKLSNHRKKHNVRYKCLKCGIMRNDRQTIKEHYSIAHGNVRTYQCPHCLKTYLRRATLKKHINNIHKATKRVVCIYCEKTFKNKDILKSHMLAVHEKQVYKEVVVKKHVCQECGAAFKTPSQLKMHSVKHSGSRDHYCVECNKAFKSAYSLKYHLKTTSPHVNDNELPLACSQCDKRFSIKRDVERHMNRIHLNIRPYQCDQCSKSYINDWSLRSHKQLTHEGYKPPLKYQCEFCEKAFARHQTLKHHIRTHTGERPFECDKCYARFSQANVLATHIRLVHLKLTRDGRPKAAVK